MQLQPLPNYSQILAFQIVHKGSDLGGRWSAPWLGGHPPYVLLVRFGEKQTHSSKVALVRHLPMFINIVTCRILVFCLGLGGDSSEEEPEAGWRKSGSMQPRPPANSPSVPVVQSSLCPCTQSSGAPLAAIGLVWHEHTNWSNHSSLVSLLQYLFQNKNRNLVVTILQDQSSCRGHDFRGTEAVLHCSACLLGSA